MIRTHCLAALLIVTTAASVEAWQAPAQPAPASRPGGFRQLHQSVLGAASTDRLALMQNSQVRQELGIDAERMLAIQGLLDDHRQQVLEVYQGADITRFRFKSEDERREIMDGISADRDKVRKRNEEVLAEFLTTAQNKRLDEIVLWIRGIEALADDDLEKELKLSGRQKRLIDEALDGYETRVKELMSTLRREAAQRRAAGEVSPAGFNPGALQARMASVKHARDEEVLAVLHYQQRKQFDQMRGRPFKLDPSAALRTSGPQSSP